MALSLIVDKVDKPDELVPYLHRLGHRHVGYGAQEEHYQAVGECLLGALEEVAGDLWTRELADTWTLAYNVIQGLMLEGAKTAYIPERRVA